MNILVTGGAGYIGSHAVKALAHAGFHPITLDDGSTGHPALIHWGETIQADLSTCDDVVSILRNYKIQAVMHFAARSLVGESHEKPNLYYRVNVLSTLNLLDAMLLAGVGVLVYSSTAAVYGLPQEIPIREDAPCKPISPYGDTKLAAERAIEWYARRYGLRTVSLRYFNAAGADPEGELGEWHDPETHLIPRLVACALNDSSPIEIYGTDYPTRDGTCIRDYIHVSDLAQAHLLGLRVLLAGGPTGVFNLGTGKGYSVRQVVEAVRTFFSVNQGQVVEKDRRPGDPPILIADATRFTKTFHWRPIQSDLRSIISSAGKWAEERRKKISSGLS